MKKTVWGAVAPSKRERERQWAIAILSRCKAGEIPRDAPEFKRASGIVGPVVTSRIVDNALVTCKSKSRRGPCSDAMFARLPGSFGSGKH